MKLRPRARALVILVAAPVVILLPLGLLASSLPIAPMQHLDRALPIYLHSFATLTLTRILLAFTWLGAIDTFAPAVALIIAWLLVQQHRRPSVLLGIAIIGAFILNESLKLVFHRPRPQPPWSFAGLAAPPEHTFSFPSGHAFFAAVLYGALAYLALQRPTPAVRRIGLIVLAIFMALAIGVSRIYFGMHHPTDVLAGYLVGTIWLTAVILADRHLITTTNKSGTVRDKPPGRTCEQ